jgi:hypothetical protein
MPFPPKKKPKGDFALLLGEPKEKPEDMMDDAEPDEDSDDFGDLPDDPDEESLDDPMADAMGDEPSIDPEQAALCETLGFTDPEQQQALIDLVKLVASPADPLSSDSGSALPPLPESTY